MFLSILHSQKCGLHNFVMNLQWKITQAYDILITLQFWKDIVVWFQDQTRKIKNVFTRKAYKTTEHPGPNVYKHSIFN